jgi:FKBP12-rapamycin complex-associated protein
LDSVRLKGSQRNIEVWQPILKVRSLVVSPREDMDMWIKFAHLARKSGRPNLAINTIMTLHGAAKFDLVSRLLLRLCCDVIC